jgi:hypothetical protein
MSPAGTSTTCASPPGSTAPEICAVRGGSPLRRARLARRPSPPTSPLSTEGRPRTRRGPGVSSTALGVGRCSIRDEERNATAAEALPSGPLARLHARLIRALPAAFGVDLRSLALLRITLAASLLVDLGARALDHAAFDSDQGILPRALLAPFARLTLPLHRMSDSTALHVLLYALAALAALALLVGYRTRAATVVSLLLLLSAHERNRMILDGGDHLLRILLFWGMFVPLGARWSLDRRRAPARSPGPLDPQTGELRSLGAAALLVQLASMYVCTGLLKLHGAPWHDGTAVRYALLAHHMVSPLGLLLAGAPRLMSALTVMVLVFEILGPFLWFSPWRRGPLRTFTTAGFLALQLGIGAAMTIGNFQSAALIWVLPFLPPWFWDRVLPRRLREADAALAAPPRPPSRAAAPVDLLAAALGAYLLICNVGSLFVDEALPGRPERLAYLLGIDQRWSMFTNPRRPTGWTVIPARLADGREVDLLTEQPLRWDQPALSADLYRGWRWRVYITDYIWYPHGAARTAAYGAYLCRTWNAEHPEAERALSLSIVWMRQTPRDDFTLGPPERVVLHEASCPR